MLAATSAPALAQDQATDETSTGLRATLLAAEGDRKATETSPPERGKIERALYRYDNSTVATPFIVQPWHGFQLAGGGFPAGAGTGVGVGFARDLGGRLAADPDRANRFAIDALGAYGTRGYSRISAGLEGMVRAPSS